MTAPAYQLRPNKAVDRYVFISALDRIIGTDEMTEYTYYGLGGPYLEDFKIVNERYRDMKMISIEEDLEVFKRQGFHKPSSNVTLENLELGEFIDEREFGEEKCVFWLDFTDLKIPNFRRFEQLLRKVPLGSVIKITMRANAKDFRDCEDCVDVKCGCPQHTNRGERFRRKFKGIMPDPNADPSRNVGDYGYLVQHMLRIAAEIGLEGDPGTIFQPINSLLYRDSIWMLTVTGILCARQEAGSVRGLFEDWEFANLDWQEPKRIEMPFLSNKERLLLEAQLPGDGPIDDILQKELGYLIGRDEQESKQKLRDYAEFYSHYPAFIRITL